MKSTMDSTAVSSVAAFISTMPASVCPHACCFQNHTPVRINRGATTPGSSVRITCVVVGQYQQFGQFPSHQCQYDLTLVYKNDQQT